MKYLGRKPRRYHRDTLALNDYSPSKTGLLPCAPPSATWGALAESKLIPIQGWGMMLNDAEGDCVYAAIGHSIINWTANASGLFVPADSDIQLGYESTGFVPGDPSTDNGEVLTHALQYWRDTGVAGHKIVGWAEFDASKKEDWQFVIFNFGLAFAGCTIRQSDMDAFDRGIAWTPGSDPILGGHGIVFTDYDGGTASLITWGRRIHAAWDWVVREVDEVYAPITQDWIDSQGQSPSGLTIDRLKADLGYL